MSCCSVNDYKDWENTGKLHLNWERERLSAKKRQSMEAKQTVLWKVCQSQIK